jgi:hypothetical protein
MRLEPSSNSLGDARETTDQTRITVVQGCPAVGKTPAGGVVGRDPDTAYMFQEVGPWTPLETKADRDLGDDCLVSLPNNCVLIETIGLGSLTDRLVTDRLGLLDGAHHNVSFREKCLTASDFDSLSHVERSLLSFQPHYEQTATVPLDFYSP